MQRPLRPFWCVHKENLRRMLMKKVFLIGDSIRMGYCQPLRERLKGTATLYWPDENCRFLQHTLRYLHEWAQACPREEIDLLHWNNGLWDACHFFGDPQPLTPIDQYEALLVHVHGQIRRVFPHAQIVFSTTTPVDERRLKVEQGVPMRRNAEIRLFNEAAQRVMDALHVPVNDLYAFVEALPEAHYDDWVHYTAEGYDLLAGALEAYLKPLL